MTAAMAAASFWAIAHGFGALYLSWIWAQDRNRYLLLFACSWSVMAMWGITLPGHHPLMQLANTVVIPTLASGLGLAAIYEMTTAARRHRKNNAAQVALLRKRMAEQAASH